MIIGLTLYACKNVSKNMEEDIEDVMSVVIWRVWVAVLARFVSSPSTFSPLLPSPKSRAFALLF